MDNALTIVLDVPTPTPTGNAAIYKRLCCPWVILFPSLRPKVFFFSHTADLDLKIPALLASRACRILEATLSPKFPRAEKQIDFRKSPKPQLFVKSLHDCDEKSSFRGLGFSPSSLLPHPLSCRYFDFNDGLLTEKQTLNSAFPF